ERQPRSSSLRGRRQEQGGRPSSSALASGGAAPPCPPGARYAQTKSQDQHQYPGGSKGPGRRRDEALVARIVPGASRVSPGRRLWSTQLRRGRERLELLGVGGAVEALGDGGRQVLRVRLRNAVALRLLPLGRREIRAVFVDRRSRHRGAGEREREQSGQ